MAINWKTLTVPEGNTTITVVDSVDVDPIFSVNWNTIAFLNSRTATQFIVDFSVPAPAAATLTYLASLALLSGTGITRTGRQIVNGALRLCGIRIATETQRTDAFDVLNELLALWDAERLLVPGVTEESFTLTVGTGIYTIGPTGTFNTARPHQIIVATLRDSTGTDTEIDTQMSLSEFERISPKTIQAKPERLYYNPEFPLAKIQFDVLPDLAYTLRLFSWKPLVAISSLDATIVLPPEYLKALRFHLAVDLAPELSVLLDNSVIQQAVASRTILQNLNKRVVPPVRFEDAIVFELRR